MLQKFVKFPGDISQVWKQAVFIRKRYHFWRILVWLLQMKFKKPHNFIVAYHAYKGLRPPSSLFRILYDVAYHAYKGLRRLSIDADIQSSVAYHAYKGLRLICSNLLFLSGHQVAYHAYKGLRPDVISNIISVFQSCLPCLKRKKNVVRQVKERLWTV